MTDLEYFFSLPRSKNRQYILSLMVNFQGKLHLHHLASSDAESHLIFSYDLHSKLIGFGVLRYSSSLFILIIINKIND